MRSQKNALATKNIEIENKIIWGVHYFSLIKIASITSIGSHSPDYLQNEFVYPAASNEFER